MHKSESRLPPFAAPPLWGLVLAGGAGSRIGRDKGELEYHGVPQARWAFELLALFCNRVYVSVRPGQGGTGVYADLPLIEDRARGGPAAGLSAAWALEPGVAWLLLGTDMPLIDRATIAALVEGRRPDAVATAFRHPAHGFEPLCAIWEPAASASIPESAPASVSLRGILDSSRVASLDMPDATAFRSVNTPRDDIEVRTRLAARGVGADGSRGTPDDSF